MKKSNRTKTAMQVFSLVKNEDACRKFVKGRLSPSFLVILLVKAAEAGGIQGLYREEGKVLLTALHHKQAK